VSVVDDQQKPEIAARRSSASPSATSRPHHRHGVSNVLLPVMPAILNSGHDLSQHQHRPEDYAGEKCNPNFFAVAWQNEDIPGAMGEVMNQRG